MGWTGKAAPFPYICWTKTLTDRILRNDKRTAGLSLARSLDFVMRHWAKSLTLFVSIKRGGPLSHSGTRQGLIETLLVLTRAIRRSTTWRARAHESECRTQTYLAEKTRPPIFCSMCISVHPNFGSSNEPCEQEGVNMVPMLR